ncbi:flagellar biosynthesis chaperone [Anaerotignum neopropionicum]|uniref:Flagellar FliJ protein n=1 Tax=Anaerotignum neopropionicum TaxID=36847 RepID=A0A136WIZ8_9FIRM|nr:flagellar export protein FliJ [Anaerotignum neopropionicum]KXL54501.1 flagellar biosynthesis chaperone [Anaerotignum neopropionicum]
MKKFTFQLESVMNFKNQRLESKKAEHAKVIALVNEQIEKIEALLGKFKGINAEFNGKKMMGLSINEAMGYSGFLYKLEVEIQQEKRQLEKLKKVEEEKRAEVVEVKIETSTLEKLKEKKLEIYNKEVQKCEELYIEEFVSRSL